MRQSGPLQILVVEDHHDSCVLLQRLLVSQGHTVLIAECCAAARRIAESAEFDIVIGDISLPDGDGCELMCELRETYGAPCIAVSGHGDEHHVQRVAQAGICLHLCKPIAFQQLLDAIEKCRPKGSPARA